MFLDPPVEAASVQELFMRLDDYISEIPEKERWNLHYTLCECEEGNKPRKFVSQSVIPFDIDGIDNSRISQYIDVIIGSLGITVNDCAIVASGNGLHFILGLKNPIDKKDYFKKTIDSYKLICSRLNRSMLRVGLPGKMDEGIWTPGHTLRLPGTKNIKTPETGYKHQDSVTDCDVIKFIIENTIESIESLARGKELEEKEGDVVFVKGSSIGGNYIIDSNATLEGCGYINYCKDNMEKLEYNQWHAFINTVVHLKDGDKIAHEWSAKDPDRYDEHQVQDTIERAIAFAHPRTCKDLNQRWDGCKDCKYFQKVRTPVDIKGEDFIATEANHFREVKTKKTIDKNGNMVEEIISGKGAVNIDDLVKAFRRDHPFCSDQSGRVFIYIDNCWKHIDEKYIEHFATSKVYPLPGASIIRDFVKLINTVSYKETKWFEDSTFKRLNLKNGVLDFRDLENIKLLSHSKKYAFKYCLDYEYDPYAECPRFDQFLKEVTKEREDLICILTEFMGYAFSDSPSYLQKALILLGEGSNGKSTFIKVLQNMANKDSYSSKTLSQLLKSEYHLIDIFGKLFNISEETPNVKLEDASNLKNIVSGGEVTGRPIYKHPQTFETRCKLIFSANRLPHSIDTSHGFFRRLLVVPFDAKFDNSLGNIERDLDYKLLQERSGILNKILSGFKNLHERGRFIESLTVDTVLKDFILQTDPIASFFEEELVIDPPPGTYEEDGDSCKRLLQVFGEYCKDHNYESKYNNSAVFSRNLMALIGDGIDRKNRSKKLGRYLKGVFIRKDLDE